METLSLTIPTLYADHHVTNIRRILIALGINAQTLDASSAFKSLTLEFDATKISRDAIIAALTAANYAPGIEAIVERGPNATADPAWDALGMRTVTTNPLDLQLSGEFRKY